MKQSWDGFTHTAFSCGPHGHSDRPVRVVPWTCPYPQEQVPQVGEVIEYLGDTFTITTTPYEVANEHSARPATGRYGWYVRSTRNNAGSSCLMVKYILKLPAPTVEVAGKRYLESEVAERVKELTPVEAT